jgi:hypothetical protein
MLQFGVINTEDIQEMFDYIYLQQMPKLIQCMGPELQEMEGPQNQP